MPNVTLKRFAVPDEVRRFPRGRLDLVSVGGLMISRATHEPGYRWSVDTAPSVGTSRCHLEHVGLVVQCLVTTVFEVGRAFELTPGTLFHVPLELHDVCVVCAEPYVYLHYSGAGSYYMYCSWVAPAASPRPFQWCCLTSA